MSVTQKMSVLARMRLAMNKEVAAMTPDEKKKAFDTMTHINDARFNLLDKISKDSPSYGEADTPPLPLPAAEIDEQMTRAQQKMEIDSDMDAEIAHGDDCDEYIYDEDDDDDEDEDEEDDDEEDGNDEESETTVPVDFTHYFEGIELEWLSPLEYNSKYVQNATAATDTPDELQCVADAQDVHNARVRLLRAFTQKYDPHNNNPFFKRLKKARHCHRVAPLTIRFDNDPYDDVYTADNANSEAVMHAFFFLKNFRNIAHAHLQRYFDDGFKKTHMVKYTAYLKKGDQCTANAFFFSKFASEGVLFFLYVRYTQCVGLLNEALGLVT